MEKCEGLNRCYSFKFVGNYTILDKKEDWEAERDKYRELNRERDK